MAQQQRQLVCQYQRLGVYNSIIRIMCSVMHISPNMTNATAFL